MAGQLSPEALDVFFRASGSSLLSWMLVVAVLCSCLRQEFQATYLNNPDTYPAVNDEPT